MTIQGVLLSALFYVLLIASMSSASQFYSDANMNHSDEQPDTTIATNEGDTTSQGDILVRSNGIREIFGVTGKGIKIGVIGNGVESLNVSQKAGQLNDVKVLSVGFGDEGTAMLEIIHDVAPDAELTFCAYGNSSETFKQAVTDLARSGCTIICDDLYFFRQPFLQDGDVANHVREILKKYPNLIYITVSGNFAPLHYQGAWKPGISVGNQTLHDFGGGDCAINMTLMPEERIIATLQWDDPWGAAGTDYDLILTDPWSGRIFAISNTTQQGSTDPFEHLAYTSKAKGPVQAVLSIARNGGTQTANILELFMRDIDPRGVDDAAVKDPRDSIFGHAAVEEVVTVGAVEPKYPFATSSDSSRGPVTIRFPADTKRWKPDICAPTNVNVSGAGGFGSPFPGTSAAAPHVAGVIAQIWSAFPELSRSDITKAIYSTADDLGPEGWDETYGYGLINAERTYRVLYDKNRPMFNTNKILFKP
ncbi:MAG TPA: S8 family serine peptidase [Methanospirillum sp.]|nr:S8 family serine peptidase [Methanospirillum sp.]